MSELIQLLETAFKNLTYMVFAKNYIAVLMGLTFITTLKAKFKNYRPCSFLTLTFNTIYTNVHHDFVTVLSRIKTCCVISKKPNTIIAYFVQVVSEYFTLHSSHFTVQHHTNLHLHLTRL